jgi:hypothetical protein
VRLFEAADGYNLGGGRGVAGSRWQKYCQKVRINYEISKSLKVENLEKFCLIIANIAI